MIYTVVGTDIGKREKALNFFAKMGDATNHIYSEHIALLEPLISATSLFGDKIIAHVIQVMDATVSRDELIRLLPQMQESKNIFIIDEPFADANRVKRLEKYSEKIHDARMEKEKGVDVFTLCNLFARRDKKGVWIEWMHVRDKETPEAIQGALWWKFSTIWQDVRAGKPSKFTLQECESIGRRLVTSSIEAHRGNKDLKVELEAILLSI